MSRSKRLINLVCQRNLGAAEKVLSRTVTLAALEDVRKRVDSACEVVLLIFHIELGPRSLAKMKVDVVALAFESEGIVNDADEVVVEELVVLGLHTRQFLIASHDLGSAWVDIPHMETDLFRVVLSCDVAVLPGIDFGNKILVLIAQLAVVPDIFRGQEIPALAEERGERSGRSCVVVGTVKSP